MMEWRGSSLVQNQLTGMQSAPLARQPQKDPSRVTSVNIFLEHSLLPAVSSLLAGSILAVDFVPMGVMESSLLFHSR